MKPDDGQRITQAKANLVVRGSNDVLEILKKPIFMLTGSLGFHLRDCLHFTLVNIASRVVILLSAWVLVSCFHGPGE
jgi:hypothetical protein